MKKVVVKTPQEKSSQQELYRLIRWIKNNVKDWNRICSIEGCEEDVGYVSDLIERLYDEKLYTIIYFVICSNGFNQEIDWAIHKTMNECFLDLPMEAVIKRFRKNLKFHARKKRKDVDL